MSFTGLGRRPRFDFGSGSFTADLPVPPWVPSESTVGGRARAGSGVAAAYQVRRDALLTLTVRLYEWEWPAWLDVLAYGQTGQALTWYPDHEAVTESVSVYLESPSLGDTHVAGRDAGFPRVMESTITLRAVNANPVWPEYFL